MPFMRCAVLRIDTGTSAPSEEAMADQLGPARLETFQHRMSPRKRRRRIGGSTAETGRHR